MKPVQHIYEFGPFRLDVGNHLLLRHDEVIQLKPKVIDTLVVLVEHRGRVLGKDELIARLWPDTNVEEANLSQNIYLLRKALGRGPDEQDYIETVPKRGYRFVAEVRELNEVRNIDEPSGTAQITCGPPDGTGTASAGVGRQQQGPLPAEARWGLSPRSVAGSFALVGLAAMIYLAASRWSKPVEPRSAVRSIAVLPFKPIGAAPRDEILELGMADTLITRLSNLRQIAVRPTSAVRKYGGLDLIAAFLQDRRRTLRRENAGANYFSIADSARRPQCPD
jgi:DNA-binding winged helix-turn-helix (wHTH) protein